MKKAFKALCLLIWLIFIAACSNADEEPKENEEAQEMNEEVKEKESSPEPVGRENGPGGFLWKVEDEDTTVYLQGTIHVAPKSLYPLHTKIEQAYEESDVVVPEIDLNNVDISKVQQLYNQYGMYKDGTSIKDHVSKEVYDQLKTTLEGFQLPVSNFESFKPWYLSSVIQQLFIQELGYVYGVDQYFLNKAYLDEKKVVPLETIEEQLSVLAGGSEDYQVEMLKETLVDPEQYKKDIDEMLEVYKDGDVEGLLNFQITDSGESNPDAEAFLEALNDERNYKMADKIMTFLEEEEQTYFVIVGALHLTLEPHIGSILEENGYDVVRVH